MEKELQRLISIAKNTPFIKKMCVYCSRYKKTNTPDSDLYIAVEIEWVKGHVLGVGAIRFLFGASQVESLKMK
jgi:predicted nucleotidyltransferase